MQRYPHGTVLIVAHDSERWPLATLLERNGFAALEAGDPGHAIRLLLDNTPRLVILAEEMPPINGTDMLPLLRRLAPVPIMVTGWDAEAGPHRVLLQGADTYITRPIDSRELLARIRALLRRTRPQCPSRDGEPQTAPGRPTKLAPLTPMEAKLLQCLIARAGMVTSRGDLSACVWGTPGKESSLRFYIFRLRKKLLALAAGDIRTVPKRGYQLRLERPELIQMHDTL